MPETLVQRAFTGGEIAPALSGRADQVRYITGLRTCKDMIVQLHGGVTKRPGTKYLGAVKDSTVTPRLIPFIFEANDQTYLIEAGNEYFRFWWHGGQVVATGTAWDAGTSYVVGDLVSLSGTFYYCIVDNSSNAPPNATYWYAQPDGIFEVPTPYTGIGSLRSLQWAQSADVLVIVHPNYQPRELRRLGHTTWTLVPFVTDPWTDAPEGLSGSAGSAGVFNPLYIVTAVREDTWEETYASAPAVVASAAIPTAELPITLAWTGVDGAAEYNVYSDPTGNGIYGFVGPSTTNAFIDPGYQPDFTKGPPVEKNPFEGPGNYPSAVAYHKQRLWLARTRNNPETVWSSQVGAYHNFSISIPLQDDDAVEFIINSTTLNPVRHLTSLEDLIVLSDGGEWMIQGDADGVVTPTTINAKQKGYVGASHVRPVVIDRSLIYGQARGTIVRDLSFDKESGALDGSDLTLFAPHLFTGYSVQDMAYARQPFSIIWVVRSDGTLLGLTYLKEHEIVGWHRHTIGACGSVCVLPDSSLRQDMVYVVTARTIDGEERRYIEQIRPAWNPNVDAIEDAFYVDCGLTYDGAPISTVTGLDHLEGERVAVLADGIVVSDGLTGTSVLVSGGAITLTTAASVIQVGLPMTSQIETLDLDVQGTSVRDKPKRVQSVVILVEGSRHGVFMGKDADSLVAERAAPWESATAIVTGQQEAIIPASFTEHGRVMLRHTSPVPLTVNAVLPNIQVGAA